jgi:hypothetical protein
MTTRQRVVAAVNKRGGAVISRQIEGVIDVMEEMATEIGILQNRVRQLEKFAGMRSAHPIRMDSGV